MSEKTMRSRIWLGLPVLVAASAGACLAFPPGDICGYGICTGDGGGTDGPTDAPTDQQQGDSGPPCDPMVDPNCISEADGIFVKSGASGTAGTKADPVGTIGAGLAKAKASSKLKVYVCAGSYAEALVIQNVVSVYGGFDCATWKYGAMNTVTVSPTSGWPVKIDGANVAISDIAFVAPMPSMAGESSIAGLGLNATLLLRRVGLTAQAGKDAIAAMDPMGFGSTAPNGNNGSGADAGAAQPNNCANGSGNSNGGVGGANTTGGGSGTPNSYPVNPNGATGFGGTGGVACGSGGQGKDGSWGPAGDGGVAAANVGKLDSTGWTPASGGAGTLGAVGQGGGGGCSINPAGGGGGGGSGGCGGAGGLGGAGGGGSIALALVNSNATLESCTLTAKNGGGGAQGQKGQQAQRGGGAGINGGQFNVDGCAGGNGGHGGSGGGGGGGAGGVSIGVLYSGNAPKVDGVVVADAQTQMGISVGSAGALGAGGVGGPAAQGGNGNVGKTGAQGIAGVAKAIMSSP